MTASSTGDDLSPCHVGADHQHDVRKPRVTAVIHFVEDAPCRQHPHHGGLARPRCHLAGIAPESFVPVGLALVTWLIRWDVDPLQEVGTGLGQEDDGLGCFELGKEQPVLTSLTPPVIKQFQCRSRDPRPALPSPFLHSLSN